MHDNLRARRPAKRFINLLSGVTAKGSKMNSLSANTATGSQSRILPIVFAAFVGAAIIFVVGQVQAQGIHDAAHDVRHATGFPCH